MNMQLEIMCSHCGRRLFDGGVAGLDIETIDDLRTEELFDRIKNLEWIPQINGNHLDAYCSERCAQ